jgi:hypothetical protein
MTDTVIISANNSQIVNNSSYVLQLPQAIELRNSEVALINFQMYYSWFNIRSDYNNNKIYVFIASQVNPILITIPNGYYSASDISGFIQNQFDILGIYWTDADGNKVYPFSIQENRVYYAITASFVVLGSLPAGWTRGSAMNAAQDTQSIRVAFNNSFGKLIGFTGGSYSNPNTGDANNILPTATPVNTSTSYNSTSTPQISPITAVNVNTNLVNNTRFSPQYSQTIYTLSGNNVSFGGIIERSPQVAQYFPINDGFYNSISISITDQSAIQPIPIIDHSASIFTLVIRKKE